MKELHGEGVATHTGPESCGVVRKDGVEALTGVRAGRVLSREIAQNRGADAVAESGRRNRLQRMLMLQKNPATSKTPSTHGNILKGNWEIPWLSARADRVGKSKDERR